METHAQSDIILIEQQLEHGTCNLLETCLTYCHEC